MINYPKYTFLFTFGQRFRVGRRGLIGGYKPFDLFGVVAIFQRVNSLFKRLWRIFGQHLTLELRHYRAAVVLLGNQMDCDTATFAPCGNHSLVYVVAKHTLAAKFGQQRWVHIDNPPSIGSDDFGRQEQQPACQNQPFYIAFSELVE